MAEEKETKEVVEPTYLDIALEKNKVLEEQLSKTREEMARMAEDNKTMIKQLLEGGDSNIVKEDTTTIEEYRKMLKNDNLNDLQHVDLRLKFRRKLLEEGYPDPFVGFGDKYIPDDNELAKAEHIAQGLEHCVEYAEGDNQVFLNEFNRITVDSPIIKTFKRK